MSIYKKFTNKYKLSKTLRFRLIPMGETAKTIAEFKNDALKESIAKDKQRYEKYVLTKEIFDEWHRFNIKNVLGSLTSKEKASWASSLKVLFELIKKAKSTNDGLEKIEKEIAQHKNKLRKELVKHFGKLSTPKDLIKKELPTWVDSHFETLSQNEALSSIKSKDELVSLMQYWKGFTTYFTGFHENRKNVYSSEEHATAIAYRTIHENLYKHIDNIFMFEQIQKKHSSLKLDKQIASLTDGGIKSAKSFFSVESFVDCFTQSGIDTYNQVLGGFSKDTGEKVQGINETLNEFRHANDLNKRDMPSFIQLYKQILSKSEKASFLPPQFEDDQELLSSIKDFHSSLSVDETTVFKNIEELSALIDEDCSGVFVMASNLTKVSQFLYPSWSFIQDAMDFEEHPVSKKKKTKKKELDYYSIEALDQKLSVFIHNLEADANEKKHVSFRSIASFVQMEAAPYRSKELQVSLKELIKQIHSNFKGLKPIFASNEIDSNRKPPLKDTDAQSPGFTQIKAIKTYLDSVQELLHRLKPFQLKKGRKNIDVPGKNLAFYTQLDDVIQALETIIPLYNKVRNHLTKKPYSLEKVKLTFENGTLANGWDKNKERDNTTILLKKDGLFFLGVMDKSHNKAFLENSIPKSIADKSTDNYYEKMEYKLLPGPNKMFPKVFFSKKGKVEFSPPKEILDLYEKDNHTKGSRFDLKKCHALIDFFKDRIEKHADWKNFNFKFSDTSEYSDISGFYREVEQQGYKIGFKKVPEGYIQTLVKERKLFLFQLHSKDFSKFSKGKPNLHTLYWKLLFDKNNLKKTCIKLNGEAELFFRDRKINNDHITHPKNQKIKNKNPSNQKKESVFKYDIVKDKRFREDQFFFHVPITLNFWDSEKANINNDVNVQIQQSKKPVNVIGIDRGERHLLYYSVINAKGEILEQGTLNTISSSQKDSQNVDYHKLLDSKEKDRDHARKTWGVIENIKEIKEGYLSHVVHKLAKLMVKYEAVVALEDLNYGFKRGRFKIEKQVYQKFERALIEKLNFLVFKESEHGDLGHPSKALQLTSKFESFQKLGKQSGFLFYVPAAYTSKVDPWTGFSAQINQKYINKERSKLYFGQFEKIFFDKSHGYFVFRVSTEKLFRVKPTKKIVWEVCTHGSERHHWSGGRDGEYKTTYVTGELKKLFSDSSEFLNEEDLIEFICDTESRSSSFYKSLHFLLNLTVQMRYSYKEGGSELDYILSPIRAKNDAFFDSRKYETTSSFPPDADANGAYHIAKKGLMMVDRLKTSKIDEKGKINTKSITKITHQDWFDYLID